MMLALAAALAAALATAELNSFTVDLALPPEKRWEEVIEAYRDLLPPMLLQLERNINVALADHAREVEEVGRKKLASEASEEEKMEAEEKALEREEQLAEILKQRHWDQAWWLRRHHLEAEDMAELAGIARLADHPEVTLDRLIAWQMVRDLKLLPTPSSSLGLIVAAPNGTVYLGQNLDFSFSFVARGKKMSLEDVVVELTFVHGGTPLFSALSYPGRIGACTGTTLSPDPATRWSVQCVATPSPRSEFAAWGQGSGGSRPVELTVRRALAGHLDFAGACQLLLASQGAETMFHVVGGGPWEGAVINNHIGMWHKVSMDLNEHLGKWFIASTASTVWYYARLFLPKTDPVTVASRKLSEIGQENVTLSSLLSLLREPSAMSKGTILTWLSAPSVGTFKMFMAKEPALRLGL